MVWPNHFQLREIFCLQFPTHTYMHTYIHTGGIQPMDSIFKLSVCPVHSSRRCRRLFGATQREAQHGKGRMCVYLKNACIFEVCMYI